MLRSLVGSEMCIRDRTLMEAELLVNRLSSVVMATVSVDTTFQMSEYLTSQNGSNASGNSPGPMCKGMQVFALLSGTDSQWRPATVVHAARSQYSLVYSDGVFEQQVPPARVRLPKLSGTGGRKYPLSEDSPSFRDFLQRHLSGGIAATADPLSSPAGRLESRFDAFETGSSNKAGHIDMDTLGDAPAEQDQPVGGPSEQEMACMEHPPGLRVGFISIPAGSEPHKRAVRDRVPPKHSGRGMFLSPKTSLYRALQQITGQLAEIKSNGVTVLQPPASKSHLLAYTVELDSAAPTQNSNSDSVGMADERTLHTVGALELLHQAFGGSTSIQWVNPSLTTRLIRQLDDPLSIASGGTPQWFDQLLEFPFLFSLAARQKFLASTKFGVSHTLNWIQNQASNARREQLAERRSLAERAAAAAAQMDDMEQMAEAAERLAEVEDEVDRDRIGNLKSDIVKLPRDKILSSAEKLMEHHASSKAVLEVQFSGEDGFGSGVTQNFYCAVAVAIQSRGINAETPMWMSDVGGDGYISCSSGLYPMPLSQHGELYDRVCDRFKFLGRLMAKALRDGFIVPVPVTKWFISMMKGETPSADWLPNVDATGGVVAAYARILAAQAREDVREGADPLIGGTEFSRQYLGLDYDMSLDEYLSAAGACWVDPVSGKVLVDGGQDKVLCSSDLAGFVQSVIGWWFVTGVKGQLEAFSAGFAEVVSTSVFALFSSQEMLCMLCGDNTVEWDSRLLEQNLRPTANLTTNSPVFQMLVQYLLQLENPDRAAFLNFVTACPRLPPGGVAALNIEVGPAGTESTIPTSQTCVPRLYIPNYESIGDLRKGFVTAFKNAEAGGFHERPTY
eukprot:TRINITY_DN2314_c0_g1_i3.p1 TRINITY_DN2314_c0_g1~~TRINITY_DN2314_c0_g1_i3.p1  ORF type:complete len:884 (+),score=215.88 TRINITY_DN2314_c0_g1_i3:115-2652(+)